MGLRLQSEIIQPSAIKAFWELADDEKLGAAYRSDLNLRKLRLATPDQLRAMLTPYRYFTIYYITDLAILVSKLPFGKIRSCLGEFLAEELGMSNPLDAHPKLYDDFLGSIGVSQEDKNMRNTICLQQLDQIRFSLLEKSWAYGVGLRGMGGECLCQIYLTAVYENLTKNPWIQEHKDEISWKFWDIHIGDVDIHHREETRKAINELLLEDPRALTELKEGYLESKTAWDLFWNHALENKGSISC